VREIKRIRQSRRKTIKENEIMKKREKKKMLMGGGNMAVTRAPKRSSKRTAETRNGAQ
jgi:hypothetical protein